MTKFTQYRKNLMSQFDILITHWHKMFPNGGQTMVFVSPSGRQSFIFDFSSLYWKVHLNDENETYLGYLCKTKQSKWFLKRYWKCQFDLQQQVFKELFAIVPHLNHNYRELEQTTYRHKCRRCSRKLKQEQRRALGIGLQCQRQEKLQEAYRNQQEQSRTDRQPSEQQERKEEEKQPSKKEQDNRKMDIDSD